MDPLLLHAVATTVAPIVHEAFDRGILDETQADALLELVHQQCPSATFPSNETQRNVAPRVPPVAVGPPAIAAASPPATSAAIRQPLPTRAPATAPSVRSLTAPRGPSRLRRARSVVSAELAVHGLAYLGVLLLFAGVTGLTVFSTGDVRRGLRPVAELVAPTSLLLAAWYLRHRQSIVVAAALEVLAAAVLPIALLASWVDGANLPPDPGEGLRIAVLTATCASLTVAYAWHSRRRPASPWRFFVAPVAWLAIAMLALVTAPDVPTTHDVAVPVPWQWAVVLVAIAATAMITRARSGHILSATDAVLLPAVGVASLLVVLAAGREGWAEGPLVVAAAAVVVALEFQRRWFVRATGPLQAAAYTAGLLPLVAAVGLGRAGFLGLVGGLALLERTRARRGESTDRALECAITLLGAVVVVGLAASVAEAGTMILAFGVATGWAHARRVLAPAQSSRRAQFEWFAALAPIGIGLGIGRALDPAYATITLGVALLAIAAGMRIRLHVDRFWATWTTTFSVLVVAATTLPTTNEDLRGRAAAGLLAALAIAVSRVRPARRLWLVVAAIQVPVALIGIDAGLAPATIAAMIATAGILPVLAAWKRTALAGHLGLAGHTLSLGACVVAISDASALVVAVVSALTGTVLTVVAQVARGSETVAQLEVVLARSRERSEARVVADAAPAVAVSALFPLGLGLLLHRTDAIAVGDPWLGVAIAACAFALSAGAMVARRCRPVGTSFDWCASIVGLAGVAIAADELHSASVATAVALAAGLVSSWPLSVRRAWLIWAQFGALTVLGAAELEVPTNRLYLALGSWGTLVAIATLWWDDRREGRRAPGAVVRSIVRGGPFVLGAVAFVTAQVAALGRPRDELGWVSLAGSGVALCLTLMLRLPPLSIVPWGLATVGGVALAPWSVFDRPWTLSLGALVPLVVAATLVTRPRRSEWWRRWDLPALVAGAAISLLAISSAPRVDQQPLTFTLSGALWMAAAGWWRRVEVAGVAALLIVVGAVEAGHGWGAVAFVVVAIIMNVAAARLAPPARSAALVTAVAASAAGWVELGLLFEWDVHQTVVATALAGGSLALLTAAAVRMGRIGSEWIVAWVGAGVIGVAAATALQIDAGRAGSASSWYPLTAGTAMIAVALALLANQVPRLPLRESTALVALLASAEMAAAADASAAQLSLSSSIAGSVVAIGLVIVLPRQWAAKWRNAVWVVGTGVTLAAVGAAVYELPSRSLLVVSLLVTTAEAAATGVLVHRVEPLQLACATACGAWIVLATGELDGAIDWFTIPVGIMLLAIISLRREGRRRRELPARTHPIVAAELLGMGLITGPPLTETIIDAPVFGAVAISGGAILAVWGGSTHVRRRVLFGSVSIALAIVLLIGTPITRVVTKPRDDSGAGPIGLWLGLAAAGVAALAAAAMIEEGRRRVRRVVLRIGQLTEGWE
jgi:hypothetical protein